jgi:hypothetical protein
VETENDNDDDDGGAALAALNFIRVDSILEPIQLKVVIDGQMGWA